jgi:hypothetical protein
MIFFQSSKIAIMGRQQWAADGQSKGCFSSNNVGQVWFVKKSQILG